MSGLEPTDVESRRAARERALELLYEAEIKDVAVGDLLDQQPIAPAALAVEPARGVEAHRDRIDDLLRRLVAPKWSLDRLAAVDRSTLRLGSYELVAGPGRSGGPGGHQGGGCAPRGG